MCIFRRRDNFWGKFSVYFKKRWEGLLSLVISIVTFDEIFNDLESLT